MGIEPKVMDSIKLVTANGFRLNCLDVIEIVVGINDIKFYLKCLVVDSLIGFNLLGTDILNLYKETIDFERNSWY